MAQDDLRWVRDALRAAGGQIAYGAVRFFTIVVVGWLVLLYAFLRTDEMLMLSSQTIESAGGIVPRSSVQERRVVLCNPPADSLFWVR